MHELQNNRTRFTREQKHPQDHSGKSPLGNHEKSCNRTSQISTRTRYQRPNNQPQTTTGKGT